MFSFNKNADKIARLFFAFKVGQVIISIVIIRINCGTSATRL